MVDFDLTDILQHIQFILLEKNSILRSYILISNNQNNEAFIILNRQINIFNSKVRPKIKHIKVHFR
ncbi:hypothetical protein C2G38_2236209 [Gigaspora rosea]|uniref:Uncharacterized protein n=1 Tax=Gigaspora rosea TaxID=44941 RepID=A0A397TPZ9_9GLOM|nr:hypothetical protein C2G38_2236209 [Gigaspora rosea]